MGYSVLRRFSDLSEGLMRKLEKISVSHSGRALVDGRVIVPVCARPRLLLCHVCMCVVKFDWHIAISGSMERTGRSWVFIYSLVHTSKTSIN